MCSKSTRAFIKIRIFRLATFPCQCSSVASPKMSLFNTLSVCFPSANQLPHVYPPIPGDTLYIRHARTSKPQEGNNGLTQTGHYHTRFSMVTHSAYLRANPPSRPFHPLLAAFIPCPTLNLRVAAPSSTRGARKVGWRAPSTTVSAAGKVLPGAH